MMTTNCRQQTSKRYRALLPLVGAACILLPAGPVFCAVTLKPLPYTGLKHAGVAGDPDPVFSAGFVLKVESSRTRTPVIQVLNPNNDLVRTVTVNIPEARSVVVYALAQGSDGSLAVSGSSIAEDGRFAEFINLIGSGGASTKIIRTDPFVPRSIALQADGSIWATGNVYRSKSAPADIDPSHSVLRHFDRNGRLLASFFPAAEINDRVRVMQGQVAATSDRVGWISNGNYKAGTGRSGNYIEVDHAGKVEEYPLPPVASERGARVVALALTSSASAFATAIEPGGSLQVFRLDRSGRSWAPTSLSGFPGKAPFLLGASGETLAFWNSADQQIMLFDASQN